jgi:hypothetical protein
LTVEALEQVGSAGETFYLVFLKAYNADLEAYWNRSVEKGKAEGKGRNLTPEWHGPIVTAAKALDEAASADKHNKGEQEELLPQRYDYYLSFP